MTRAALHPRSPVAALIAFVTAALLLLALPAGAQSSDNGSEGPNYTVWNALAALAENTLEDPNATDDVLNAIRAEVVSMRTQFLTAQEAQQDRIAALREQIAALGPVPAEGQTEAPEITQRRDELNRLLAERQAPLLAADEAFTRADAIIRAIDRELRARQADALMQLGPTPANPANWLAGLNALISSALTLHGEAYNAWLDPARYQEMITDLPITIGAVLLALLLLLRGRRWMEHLTTRLLQSTTILRGRVVVAFFVSLSQLAVPFAGLMLLSTAVQLTRMTGPTIEAIAQALVPAGMSVFFARWLSLHIFPIVEDQRLSLNLSDDDRRRARGNALVLAFLSAIETLFIPFLAPETQPPGALAVLVFPLVVLASLTIWRFTRVLRRHTPRRIERDGIEIDSSPFFDRMLRLGCRLLTVMALIAPVLGAAGYMAAAQHIVFPAISSLGLIGLVMVLHRLITAIYVTVVGDEERRGVGSGAGRSDAVAAGTGAAGAGLGRARDRPVGNLGAVQRGRQPGRDADLADQHPVVLYRLRRRLHDHPGAARRAGHLGAAQDLDGEGRAEGRGLGRGLCRHHRGGAGRLQLGGDRPQRPCNRCRCAVGRYRFRLAKYRVELCFRHHPAVRTPGVRRGLGRGRHDLGDRGTDFSALDGDPDFRPLEGDRAQRRPDFRRGDELYQVLEDRAGDRAGGRGLWHRYPPGHPDPAGNCRERTPGYGRSETLGAVPRLWRGFAELRDPGDPA